MRITIHHSKMYDWEKVPADVVVIAADVASGKVRDGSKGDKLMHVTRPLETNTTIALPEHQIIAKIIDDKTRPAGGRTLTRKQAVAMYISEHVLRERTSTPAHTHRKWITKIEVEDDGPVTALFDSMMAEHVAAGNIEAADVAEHRNAYLEVANSSDHAAHLTGHFRVGKAAS